MHERDARASGGKLKEPSDSKLSIGGFVIAVIILFPIRKYWISIIKYYDKKIIDSFKDKLEKL